MIAQGPHQRNIGLRTGAEVGGRGSTLPSWHAERFDEDLVAWTLLTEEWKLDRNKYGTTRPGSGADRSINTTLTQASSPEYRYRNVSKPNLKFMQLH